MSSFKIPDTPAPHWRQPEAGAQPVSEQVGDLVEQLQQSGEAGAVRALMQGLAVLDRAAVYDRHTDADELPELAARSQPGEAYLLASQDHAAAFLHLPDGRKLVFDSEGIFGIGDRACLATYDPQAAPRRTKALGRHYGEFYGLLRLAL